MTTPTGGAGSGPRALEGRTVWITGASRGIGAATARSLAAAGARVALTARSREPLEALAREVGGTAVAGDVTDPAEVERIGARVRALFDGAPDLLVASAGVFDIASVEETSPEILARNLDVNLRGSFLAVRAVLPGMRERGSGVVIQIGSISGRKAFPGNAAYSASKFGLRGFHEVLLEELRGSGVRATLVEPAATDTPIWDPLDPDGDPNLPPRSAMMSPHDVAEAVRFVATRPPGIQIPFLPLERG
ncbi:MAG: SDR family oxidoreductase [Gemmatimonadales bacterium]|nr:MAG: SDR family oxidoreductase [Gemmatimonadales bacterium]